MNTAIFPASDSHYIEAIKLRENDVINKIYVAFKKEFIKWAASTFNCSSEDALDAYQDAIIILCDNIHEGKLTTLNSSLKTYLFAIGKNMLFQKMSKKQKLENNISEIQHLWYESVDKEDSERYKRVLANCLNCLREPCRSILRMHYYEKLPMKTIAEILDYKNEDVVKSQKLRCIKALRAAVLQELKGNSH